MNLIQRPLNQKIDLMDYRLHQYSLIPEFIDIGFEYCRRFGLSYDKIDIKIYSDESYHSIYHYCFDKIRIKLDDYSSNFLELDIPRLLHDTFFKLKGAYYIPLIYLLDEPITFKKNSIKLYSLFKPITLYLNDNRVILDGNNIPISRFFRLYEEDENELKNICEILETQYIAESRDESISKMTSILGSKNINITDIIEHIDLIFFDKWTKDLYSTYYKIENINMKLIIDLILGRIKNNEFNEFNNLKFKRLIFIELLLDPFFRAINSAVHQLKAGKPLQSIPIKSNAIITHFYSSVESKTKSRGLCGNNLYSISNGYTGILGLKSSFKNPKSPSEMPRSVSSVHYGYKHKVCPITISNKTPGVVVSLVPNQKIDLRYGLLLD